VKPSGRSQPQAPINECVEDAVELVEAVVVDDELAGPLRACARLTRVASFSAIRVRVRQYSDRAQIPSWARAGAASSRRTASQVRARPFLSPLHAPATHALALHRRQRACVTHVELALIQQALISAAVEQRAGWKLPRATADRVAAVDESTRTRRSGATMLRFFQRRKISRWMFSISAIATTLVGHFLHQRRDFRKAAFCVRASGVRRRSARRTCDRTHDDRLDQPLRLIDAASSSIDPDRCAGVADICRAGSSRRRACAARRRLRRRRRHLIATAEQRIEAASESESAFLRCH